MISLLPMIPLVYFGIRLSIIDLKTHRLPNQLVGWFVLIENAILVAFSLSTDDLFQLITALGVAVATTTIYLLLYLLSRG